MRKLKASGAIGMLLTILIIGLMFALIIPLLKGLGGGKTFSNSSINNKSAEEELNKKIEDIEKYRNQTSKESEKINQEY